VSNFEHASPTGSSICCSCREDRLGDLPQPGRWRTWGVPKVRPSCRARESRLAGAPDVPAVRPENEDRCLLGLRDPQHRAVPARFYIEQRIDETVSFPSDDTIVSAEPHPAIVERGKLVDTLIVEATCGKYIEHQPIERRSARFARAGVDVALQMLGRSVRAHVDLLMPVAELIAERTRAHEFAV
jgi:hypothetical protein